jgi:hypothetical protein
MDAEHASLGGELDVVGRKTKSDSVLGNVQNRNNFQWSGDGRIHQA